MKTALVLKGAVLAAVLSWTTARPAFAAERKIYVSDYRDRMEGAWIGQSVGVTYGAPTEFAFGGKIMPNEKVKTMPVWKPEMINGTFGQDDLYVEMTFMRTLERRGIDVSTRLAGIDFANSRYRLWCANANARNNLRKGIAAPWSSDPRYHPSTDDIDYQIEADFSGILSPGMPTRVIRLGNQFGLIMNRGDGLFAGQFVGGMYAEAYFATNRMQVVEGGLRCIPPNCRYAEMVRDMVRWHEEDPVNWSNAWTKAVAKYQSSNCVGRVTWKEIDVKINGAMVLLGFLWGDGDIEKTMYVSTAGGFDSDCNPSSAVGVLGAMLGAKVFGEKYVGKLDRTRKWEYTDYTYPGLLAASEKLTRQLVVAEGGSIGTDEKGEYFLIADPERYSAAENDAILYLPGGFGSASKDKPGVKTERLIDACWMWGHETGQVDGTNNQWKLDVATKDYPMPVGTKSFGLDSLNVVRWDKPDRAFRDSLKGLRRVTWPVSGIAHWGSVGYDELADWCFQVADEMPNVSGFDLDDFFMPDGKTQLEVETPVGKRKSCPTRFSYAKLSELRKRMRAYGRPLELRLVTYDALLGQCVDPHDLQPTFELADTLTYWTWKAKDLDQMPQNLAKVKALAPDKRIELGIYLYDFGDAREMPVERMEYQLETGLDLWQRGEIGGFVFLCSSICNRDLAAVKFARDWLRRHAKDTRKMPPLRSAAQP